MSLPRPKLHSQRVQHSKYDEPQGEQIRLQLRFSPDKYQTAKSSPVIKSNQPSKIKEIEARAAKKTMAELDEELRLKLEGRSGEGGEAGLELEDGRPSAMKRGVKNNMFRVI